VNAAFPGSVGVQPSQGKLKECDTYRESINSTGITEHKGEPDGTTGCE
jgi:hypothetical protein